MFCFFFLNWIIGEKRFLGDSKSSLDERNFRLEMEGSLARQIWSLLQEQSYRWLAFALTMSIQPKSPWNSIPTCGSRLKTRRQQGRRNIDFRHEQTPARPVHMLSIFELGRSRRMAKDYPVATWKTSVQTPSNRWEKSCQWRKTRTRKGGERAIPESKGP